MKEVELEADVDFDELAEKSEGYSGHDISIVCRDAAMMSVRRFMDQARKDGVGYGKIADLVKEQRGNIVTTISRRDFLDAFARCNKSISEQDLTRYSDWMQEFGSS